MDRETLEKIVGLAEVLGNMFVVTAGAEGLPHLAVARKFRVASEKHLVVTGWLCPTTLANLDANLHVALVVWDSQADRGFQAFGVVQETAQKSLTDGYDPRVDNDRPQPQVEMELTVRVDKAVSFTDAPHSDEAS